MSLAVAELKVLSRMKRPWQWMRDGDRQSDGSLGDSQRGDTRWGRATVVSPTTGGAEC